MATVIVGTIVIGTFIGVGVYTYKRSKKGGCSGCNGCSGCAHAKACHR